MYKKQVIRKPKKKDDLKPGDVITCRCGCAKC